MAANGLMQLAVTRDDAHRVVAIRVRLDGAGMRGTGRNVRKRLSSVPGSIARLGRTAWNRTSNLAGAARTAVPRARFRRDSLGRPQAVVLQFGADLTVSAAVLNP